jgi:hypothetical protein
MKSNLFGRQSKIMETSVSNKNSKQSAQKRAAKLLDWLIDFLPGAIPPSAEDAILDVPDDVHALFWHRSELQKLLETIPEALNQIQKIKLAGLDRDIRAAALLLVGAGKGMLHRYRQGRYDRSHWWWYLDDILTEENLVCNQPTARVKYAVPEEAGVLLKVAEPRAEYKRKSRGEKK